MKKLFYCSLFAVCSFLVASAAHAQRGYDDPRFIWEITQGLDIVASQTIVIQDNDYAGGALGREIYSASDLNNDCPAKGDKNNCCKKKAPTDTCKDNNYELYIPTDMYIRMGAGYNIGFLTSDANYGGMDNATASSDGTWGLQFGLGWNISPFVRGEMDVQIRNFRFENAPWSAYDLRARSQSVGANLYFDIIRRYERFGDITERNRFVPFIGFGLSVGAIDFDDAGVIPIGFADGNRSAFFAPRAVAGVSFALTNLVNLDLAYQYEMMISKGFGWQTKSGRNASISDLILTLRVNF